MFLLSLSDILSFALANGGGGIDFECQDFGFDYGVAKWECNGGWSIGEEIYAGTSVTGSCSEADWDVGSSGADGIVVKAGSTVHYSVVGTSGTVEQTSPDISHITFCGYDIPTTTTTTTCPPTTTTTTPTTTTTSTTTTTVPPTTTTTVPPTTTTTVPPTTTTTTTRPPCTTTTTTTTTTVPPTTTTTTTRPPCTTTTTTTTTVPPTTTTSTTTTTVPPECGDGNLDEGEECEEDEHCPCPEDGCIGYYYYDYPDHGVCLGDCTCDVRTEACDKPCKPIMHLNDSRCMPPTTTTTTTPPTTTTTLPPTTTTTTIPDGTTTTTTTTQPTTTTTVPTTTTTTTVAISSPSPPRSSGGGGGGGGPWIIPCELNGICDSWENSDHCPSDCPEETTTTTTTTTTRPTYPFGGVCGNGECEEGEDFLNCREDCLQVVPVTTTTTTTTLSTTGLPTGMAAAFSALGANLYFLVMMLTMIAFALSIIRFRILPKMLLQKGKGKRI